jgi:hypothetical protein
MIQPPQHQFKPDSCLETLAPRLPVGQANADCQPEYELMSGAFIWRDECPDLVALPQDQVGCLRSIWRYRTSLITGIADNRFEQMWHALKTLQPDWVGFEAKRCSYSEELAHRYSEIKNKKRKQNP